MALAFDRKTGRELWRKKVADRDAKDRMSTFANASPVTDGKRVWFFYGTGDLACFDMAGKERWRWGTWNANNMRQDYRLVPSPVAGGGVVLGCGPKREPVFAVKAGSTGEAPMSNRIGSRTGDRMPRFEQWGHCSGATSRSAAMRRG